MKPYFAYGLFALYAVAVSLLGILGDRESPRLAAMKALWGRTHGIALHFMSNVALPLVLGIVFLSRGIVAFDTAEAVHIYAPAHHLHALNHLQYRQPVYIGPGEMLSNGEIGILLASNSPPPSSSTSSADFESDRSPAFLLFTSAMLAP